MPSSVGADRARAQETVASLPFRHSVGAWHGRCTTRWPKDTIDALELLKDQHDEVEELLDAIESSDNSDDKQELFTELADKLAAHATIEEKIFYPGVMSEETCDLLLESTEEHLAVKRVLADLLEMHADDERFDAKLTVLKEHVRHHARDEEEGKLFSILREQLTDETLAGLGNECLAMPLPASRR